MESKEYKTKDIGEAAALCASGIKIIRYEKELECYWFIFDATNAQNTSDLYWSGELKVSAKVYNDCYRTLKDRLFSRAEDWR